MHALIDIVLPVFAVVAAGYLCGVRGLLGPDSSDALNRFVYWVALPALLFHSMASVDVALVFNLPFIMAVSGALALTWIIAGLFSRLVFKTDFAESVMHGLNAAYGNSGYMGIPLAITAYGEAAALPAIILALVTVLSIGLAIIPIEIARNRNAGLGSILVTVLKSLATNPMLIAPLAGLAWASTNIALPTPIVTFTTLLGNAAGPCALFAIGLFLVGKPMAEGAGEVISMTLAKLILHPALTALAIYWLIPQTDPLWIKIAILSTALPIGAGTFVLAQAHDLYVRRTSTAIMATTVLAVVTISLFFVVFPVQGP